jgi:hypothetical protein
LFQLQKAGHNRIGFQHQITIAYPSSDTNSTFTDCSLLGPTILGFKEHSANHRLPGGLPSCRQNRLVELLRSEQRLRLTSLTFSSVERFCEMAAETY